RVWAMKTLLLLTLRLFVRVAGSEVMTQNPDDADELVRRGIVRRDRISIIRGSGIDVAKFMPFPEPQGGVVVAMVSRMLRYKGVEDGINGILVPQGDPRALADALQRLIVDKELRLRMGRGGRLRVERMFTKEIIVRQTLDMYGAALGRKL